MSPWSKFLYVNKKVVDSMLINKKFLDPIIKKAKSKNKIPRTVITILTNKYEYIVDCMVTKKERKQKDK